VDAYSVGVVSCAVPWDYGADRKYDHEMDKIGVNVPAIRLAPLLHITIRSSARASSRIQAILSTMATFVHCYRLIIIMLTLVFI
jgi:hypothetical protein